MKNKDHFSTLSDDQKSEYFYEALKIVCELMEGEELHNILRDDFHLTHENIREHKLLSDSELMAVGMVISEPNESHIRLWHVLRKADFELGMRVAQDGSPGSAALDALVEVVNQGNPAYQNILDAYVKETRSGPNGNTEIVIEGVSPDTFERFCEECEAFEEKAQAMGQAMQ